jgi:hypothetical protein
VTSKPALVVDFVAVIDELRRHGIAPGAIAGHLRIARSTVYEYHKGNTIPPHPVGEAMLDLWAGVTGKPSSAVPRTPPLPSVSATRFW